MAVVIRAPDIDHPIKAPNCELIIMISDIRCEIGRISIGPDQDLVLLPAIGRGFIPNGAILFIGKALFRQGLDDVVNGPLSWRVLSLNQTS